jgi:mono/diheme cytochrome c family protein
MARCLAILALLVASLAAVAGLRGCASRKPPIELFADMVRQPKMRPQSPSGFFTDRLGSRQPLPGTVARGSAWADLPVNTGRMPGSTNFIETNPHPLTPALLARGQERFQITCLPCHGAQGDGRGITTKYGMAVIASLHDPRIVRLSDGELFQTVSQGRNLMQGYASTVTPTDRWAILAYVRALQLSRLGEPADLTPQERAQLPP